MSETLRRIISLVQAGDVLISAHGYDEIAEDSILAGELIDGVAIAVVVEDYPEYPKGRVLLSSNGTGERQPDPRGLGHPERTDVAGGAGHGLQA